MKLKKIAVSLLALLLIFALCAQTAFAADVKAVKDKTAAWLQNPENTQFDYTETAYVDSLIDWTAFTLARDFREVPTEYPAYIDAAVQNSFDSLYPSDLARIILSVTACGLDAKSIGGHDLLAALENVDYSAQIFLSSLVFPLLAMDFKADFTFDDAIREEIVQMILACQQPDGGWSYCSEDLYGYGIYTDPDSTAMALQSLAPYADNAEVSAAADRAFAYLQAQQGETGAVLSYGAPSAESTAQVILALCAWGKNPETADFTVNGNTLVDGLCAFVTENGGALNYADVEDPLTTYQVMQALEAVERYGNGKATVFTYDERPTEDSSNIPVLETTTSTQSDEQTEVSIPKTGGMPFAGGAVLLTVGAAAVLLTRKKDEV
ncbi:MAG: prenyltransferase/squalene oxidase repeat-containing protein [Candidatus Fimenecus sp.]